MKAIRITNQIFIWTMTPRFLVILAGLIFCTHLAAQEVETKILADRSLQKETEKSIYGSGYEMKAGEILYTLQTGKQNVLGVTVVNDKVIVSSGGNSSELSADNYFYVYNFDGTLVGSYPQGSTTGYGFRDLAFDGTYILGSENTEIKKIDPTTFQIVGSITNTTNNPHRGLAYDATDNVLWSTNGSTGPVLQMNPATGGTLLQFDKPASYYKPYGIALERFINADNPNLWFAEPWIYGSFRLSMMDCSDGLIYYTIDLNAALGNPDSCLSGGLEIIDNHPNYPGKLIALAVEQNTNTVLFVDLTIEDAPDMIYINNAGSFGGWLNGVLIQNNFAFLIRANHISVVDLSNNLEKLSSVSLDAEASKGIIAGDYLYLHYPTWETEALKRIEIINISNKSHITKSGAMETSRIMSLGVDKLANASTTTNKNLLFILTKESNNTGVDEKILIYNIDANGSLTFADQLVADVKDITANGDYLYVLQANGMLSIYDIKNASFVFNGNINIANAEKIFLSGNYIYLACNNSRGLRIIDVSNPASPLEAASFGNNIYSFYDDIFVAGSKVYLKTTNFDLIAVDITNPIAPVEFSAFNPEGIGNFKFAGVFSGNPYITNSGILYSIDYTLPASPNVVKTMNEPTIVRGHASIGNTLYTVGNNEILLNNINENGELTFNSSFVVNKANKIFTDGNYLFIADNENKLYFYNLSLQLLATYNAGAPVIDLEAVNNLLCLTLYNSTTVKLVDYSNPSVPVEKFSYDLPYNGKAAAVSSNGSLLFTASNKTTIGGNTQGYFQSIDISNPMNPVLLADVQIGGGNAIYNLCLDNNTLFIGGSDNNGWFPLEAWNVTNASDPVRIGRTMFSFPGPLSDIAYKDGYIFATVPDPGLLLSYRWDSGINEFFAGPSIELSKPIGIDLMDYTPARTFSKSVSAIQGGKGTYSYAIVNNGSIYGSQEEGSKGTNVVKILKVPRQNNPALANLVMGVNPPEAADHGCTTEPAPGGPYTYIKNSTVGIKAIDNPSDGWNFKEWTGAGGGSISSVVMDVDKVVVANFVEVKLTVSGSAVEDAVCPEIAKKEQQKLLPIVLCASEADGWAVQGITFKGSGTGNEMDCELLVYKGTSLVGSGLYLNDNGERKVSFSPPVIVPKNQCVTLELFYKFTYTDLNYAVDTTYTFLVETQNISGTPLVFPGGLIEGKAKRKGPLTIARIYNEWDIGFSKIQDAVNSNLTQDGGTCYLCEGTYVENVEFNEKSKEVTVTSVGDRDKTIVQPKQLDMETFRVIGIDNIKIQKLTIQGPGKYGVNIYESTSSKVINNVIKNLETGLALGEDSKFITVENNLIDVSELSISMVKTENDFIKANTLKVIADTKEPDIMLYKAHKNSIYENKLLEPGGGLKVHLWHCKQNKISYHDFKMDAGKDKYPQFLLEDSQENEIFQNKGIEIVAKESDSNKIFFNEILKIDFNNSESNEIRDNVISGKDRVLSDGIFLSLSPKNIIIRNVITYNDKNGIYVDFLSGKTEIKWNNINNNKEDGIQISSSHDNIMYKNVIENNHSNGVAFFKGSGACYQNSILNNDKNGVEIFDAGGVDLFENKINGHNKSYQSGSYESDGVGVYISDAAYCFINRNTLKENCTAIQSSNSRNINISGNDVSNSFCWFTGIHLDNSTADIVGNNIMNNQGNGVFYSNNSGGLLNSNNIYGNSAKGANNADPGVIINASNNWWGNQTGPTESDIAGNLDVSTWLSSPVSLYSQAAKDTMFSAPGRIDSLIVHFRNLLKPDDIIDVMVSDQFNWITSPHSFSSQMHDSLGTSATIIFRVPDDTGEGLSNKVTVSANSQSDANSSTSLSFNINVYKPLLKELIISPDSTSISVGDTLVFSVTGNDQFGNNVGVFPTWESSMGEINGSGLFTCQSVGKAEITASDPISGISGKTAVLISEQETSLAMIRVLPDTVTVNAGGKILFEAKGYNNFGFPHQTEIDWSCDCGVIDDNGLYIADSISTTCLVTAENLETGIKGTAVVNVRSVVSVEKYIVPEDFSISQNYPNPFNPSTTVKFGIPIQSSVQIEIYNILGERVHQLVNEVMPAGYYSINWNAGGLASGIYFYTITAKAIDGKTQFRKVMKMLLLK